MFDIAFLNRLRQRELSAIVAFMHANARVLEIGGGTGAQASELRQLGYDVISIDVAGSSYRPERLFPVIDYDGYRFPLDDSSVDIVFSSNTLEHIRHLGAIHAETQRVLRPDGYAIHVMPTPIWRFWSSLTHYVTFTQRESAKQWQLRRGSGISIGGRAQDSQPISTGEHGLPSTNPATGHVFHRLRVLRALLVPPRHGAVGSAASELYSFSSFAWVRHFHAHAFTVEATHPMGLFYTGEMALGRRLSFSSRARLARFLGSSATLYKVRPLQSRRADRS